MLVFYGGNILVLRKCRLLLDDVRGRKFTVCPDASQRFRHSFRRCGGFQLHRRLIATCTLALAIVQISSRAHATASLLRYHVIA